MNKIFLVFFLCFLGMGTQVNASKIEGYEEETKVTSRQSLVTKQLYENAEDLTEIRLQALKYGVTGAVIGAIALGAIAPFMIPCAPAATYMGMWGMGAMWGGGSSLIIWASHHPDN